MKIRQFICRKPSDLASIAGQMAGCPANLALVFGSTEYFSRPDFGQTLQQALPGAQLIGCSTAGEIAQTGVDDGSCSITAIEFEKTRLKTGSTQLQDMDDSFAAGKRLGEQLRSPGLRAVLVFGPGVRINGSALIDGLASVIGSQVPITGGLAGDAGAFEKTFTLGPAGVSDGHVVAVGFHGDALRLGHGSFGGWEPFGPARKVTRCDGNILYELDGEPALAIYKRYLGDHAARLPASGLLFPFAMQSDSHHAAGLIRTILGIDEADGALILAGDIDPQGYLKLMHASTDKLVNGAETAAEAAAAMQEISGPSLAILVSCVGRKLVMGDRVDEEVETVGETLGHDAVLTGFYSYGEICPFGQGAASRLHNQTMTITCLSET